MKTNLTNLAILIHIALFCTIGCGSSSSNTSSDKTGERRVERGRLKFVKKFISVSFGREPIYRSQEQDFYINGKKWSPEGDAKFSEKINWCDTSPNPKVEILRCFGDSTENYSTTYILRMKGDKPDVQKIEQGLPNIWANSDGRWLIYKDFFVNVETDEKISIKMLPFKNGVETSLYLLGIIAISPDMKTIVVLPDSNTKKEAGEEFMEIWITDVPTGKTERQKVSFTKNPWLTDHENPADDIQPPPAPSKHFVWEKDAENRDRIATPQLLGEIKEPTKQ